jgi:hypothetical protein
MAYGGLWVCYRGYGWPRGVAGDLGGSDTDLGGCRWPWGSRWHVVLRALMWPWGVGSHEVLQVAMGGRGWPQGTWFFTMPVAFLVRIFFYCKPIF